MGVVIAVLGMHRSGTSAVAGVLAQAGFAVPGEALPPTDDNPRGYWEPREVVEIHDELLQAVGSSWSDPRSLPPTIFAGTEARRARDRLAEVLARRPESERGWVLKDPRLCRLLPLWFSLFAELGLRVRFIHVVRSPIAVARSLGDRDRLGFTGSLWLWLRHLLEAELATRGHERFWVRFEDWVGGGRRDAMGRLAAWLGASPAEVESLVGTIEPAVDPDLVHYDSDLTAETKALQSFPWVRAVYAAAIGLCANPAADVAAFEEGRQRLHEVDALMPALDGSDQPLLFGLGVPAPGADAGRPRGRSFETRLDALTAEIGRLQTGLQQLDEAWRRQLRAHDQIDARWGAEQARSARLLAELVDERRARATAEGELAACRGGGNGRAPREAAAADPAIDASVDAARPEPAAVAGEPAVAAAAAVVERPAAPEPED